MRCSDTEEEIIAKLDGATTNFVCQEILKNHPSFNVGEKSLNTMRVVTLFYKGQVEFVGAAFRMSTGNRVDNWDAGGIVCPIDKEGKLGSFAVNGRGVVFNKHPNGFVFNGHILFRGKEVIELAIKCHKRITQQKYISWDFTVDEKGNIVFIEMNSPGGSEVLQCLGINAYINQEIAKEIYDDYIYLLKANLHWNYREHANYVILLKYYGRENQVTIPDQINGKPVTLVIGGAFSEAHVSAIICSQKVRLNLPDLKTRGIIVQRVE